MIDIKLECEGDELWMSKYNDLRDLISDMIKISNSDSNYKDYFNIYLYIKDDNDKDLHFYPESFLYNYSIEDLFDFYINSKNFFNEYPYMIRPVIAWIEDEGELPNKITLNDLLDTYVGEFNSDEDAGYYFLISERGMYKDDIIFLENYCPHLAEDVAKDVFCRYDIYYFYAE